MARITDRLRREFQKALKRKIISLAAIQKGAQNAESLKDVGQLVRDGHHPLHAIYKNVMNLISVFVEEITVLPFLHRAYDFLEKAEDLYCPGYPPLSPITVSYYV